MLSVVAGTFQAELEALSLGCTLLVTEHQAAGGVGVVAAQGGQIAAVLIAGSIPAPMSCERPPARL